MLHSKVFTLITTKTIHKIDTYDFDGFSNFFSLGYTLHSLFYAFYRKNSIISLSQKKKIDLKKFSKNSLH